MKKIKLSSVIVISVLGLLLTSCNATMHTVGSGGKGNGKPGQYDAKKKQWYLFWGLLPLNKVDSKDLAGGAENYTVRTTTSFGDGLISIIPVTSWFGLRTQTVRVSKGDK